MAYLDCHVLVLPFVIEALCMLGYLARYIIAPFSFLFLNCSISAKKSAGSTSNSSSPLLDPSCLLVLYNADDIIISIVHPCIKAAQRGKAPSRRGGP